MRHLGGQPAAGAVLEAVSEGCNQLQEEDTTNEQGVWYRVVVVGVHDLMNLTALSVLLARHNR